MNRIAKDPASGARSKGPLRPAPLNKAVQLPGRVRAKVAEVGILYASYRVLRPTFVPRLFDFRSGIFFALELSDLPPPQDTDGRIREVTERDLSGFVKFGDDPDFVVPRLRRGFRVWAFERDGDWLAAVWLSPESKVVAKWLLVDPLPGDVWADGIRVRKRFRGRGIAPRLLQHLARECAQAGKTRLLGAVDSLNRNSQRALDKVGYLPVGRIFYVSLLGLSLVRYGSTWRLGWWSEERPLRVSIDRTGV